MLSKLLCLVLKVLPQVLLLLFLFNIILSQNQVFEHGQNKENQFSISILVINTKEKELKKSKVSLIDSDGIIVQEKKN